MSHLLARGIVQAVGQVDFMVEEGRLGDGSRNDRDLSLLASNAIIYLLGNCSPTVSLSRSSIFILEDEEPDDESPAETILEMYPDTVATTSMGRMY